MKGFKLSLVAMVVVLGACASNPKSPSADATPANTVKDEGSGSAVVADNSFEQRDKFESYNRAVFAFNMRLDRWLLKPVARGYKWLAPEPVELGVSNFFSNLSEISNVVNDVLQWKWKQAGNDTGRFVLNTTVGVGGLFDVARHAGLEKAAGEDFGQTLAVWGVPQGPYFLLPFLGPSTVTATAGMPVDWYTNPVSYIEDNATSWTVKGVNIIHSRAQLLETEKLAKGGDFYIFVRDAYLQRRDFLVKDGQVVDDFGGDFGGEEEGFDF